MAVVGCSILCSKFAKNRLSAWLCPDPLHGGAYSAPQLDQGEGRGKGRWKGRRGGEERQGRTEEGKGRKERREGEGMGIHFRMKILHGYTALQATVVVNGFYDSAVYDATEALCFCLARRALFSLSRLPSRPVKNIFSLCKNSLNRFR